MYPHHAHKGTNQGRCSRLSSFHVCLHVFLWTGCPGDFKAETVEKRSKLVKLLRGSTLQRRHGHREGTAPIVWLYHLPETCCFNEHFIIISSAQVHSGTRFHKNCSTFSPWLKSVIFPILLIWLHQLVPMRPHVSPMSPRGCCSLAMKQQSQRWHKVQHALFCTSVGSLLLLLGAKDGGFFIF